MRERKQEGSVGGKKGTSENPERKRERAVSRLLSVLGRGKVGGNKQRLTRDDAKGIEKTRSEERKL